MFCLQWVITVICGRYIYTDNILKLVRFNVNVDSNSSAELHTSNVELLLPTQHATNREKRAATARPERVWDYAVIPYEIDANFSGVHKALFKQESIYFNRYNCSNDNLFRVTYMYIWI